MIIVDRDNSANAPDWDEHLHCFSKQQVHSPVPVPVRERGQEQGPPLTQARAPAEHG